MKAAYCLNILFCLCIAFGSNAQRGDVYRLNFSNMYTGEAVDAFDLREKSLSNKELYYFEEWNDVYVKFRNGKLLSGYKGRYDLMLGSLEILRGRDIVEVPSTLIEEFLIVRMVGENVPLIDTVRFVRLNEPKIESSEFFEVLVEGDIILLKGVTLERQSPNYVPTHDAGSLKPKLVRGEDFVVVSEDQVDILEPRRKKSEEILERYSPGCGAYIRENKVNFREEIDIVRLIQHLNDIHS